MVLSLYLNPLKQFSKLTAIPSLLLFIYLGIFVTTAEPTTHFHHIYARDTSLSSVLPVSTNSAPISVNSFATNGNISAVNSTVGLQNVLSLKVVSNESSLSIVADVAYLTASTGRSIISSDGYEGICVGKLIPAETNLYIPWPDIALINCDDPDLAKSLLVQTSSQTSDCIILYSLQSNACNLSSSSSTYATQLGFVMTLLSNTVSQSILSNVKANTAGDFTGVVQALTLATPGPSSDSTSSSNSSGSTVAMIILYFITGIIAFLFLFVIISGAIRVHKHPERYGLPPPEGFPNQGDDAQYSSMFRAKGIARAVLDSIPLVTVRMRSSSENNKELAASQNKDINADNKNSTDVPLSTLNGKSVSSSSSETASQLATSASTALIIDEDDDSSCPICFDNFEDGQILRVLPCKHRFHAICVDPWLLNSSTHCPMCRVDLSLSQEEAVPENPPGSSDAENGNGQSPIVIPEGYEVDTSLFNRFLDIWNAHLLPKEARRAALAKFHREAELRRQLRSQRSNNRNNTGDTTITDQSATNEQEPQESTPQQSQTQNQNLWLKFVASRRRLHQLRLPTRQRSSENTVDNQNNTTNNNNSNLTNHSNTPSNPEDTQEVMEGPLSTPPRQEQR